MVRSYAFLRGLRPFVIDSFTLCPPYALRNRLSAAFMSMIKREEHKADGEERLTVQPVGIAHLAGYRCGEELDAGGRLGIFATLPATISMAMASPMARQRQARPQRRCRSLPPGAETRNRVRAPSRRGPGRRSHIRGTAFSAVSETEMMEGRIMMAQDYYGGQQAVAAGRPKNSRMAGSSTIMPTRP